MKWRVTSSIGGGKSYTAAAREEYAGIAQVLDDAASQLSGQATAWSAAALQLGNYRASGICQLTGSGASGLAAGSDAADFGIGIDHESLPYHALIEGCDNAAVQCQTLSQGLSAMASLLVRAHSLYSQAEHATRGAMNSLMEGSGTILPWQTAAGFLALATGGAIASSVGERRFNPLGALSSTAWAQEGALRAASNHVNVRAMGVSGLGAGVDRAAGILSMGTSRLVDFAQGNLLRVERVEATRPVVGESHSVAQSLANLQRLAAQRRDAAGASANGNGSNLDYGTIAIQKYRNADGTLSWLVTIPGTDGKPDSAFGWPHNLEVMSADAGQRMRGDSARMVAEAMKQAGIGSTDQVALIGHSQGGIVAAAIASDMKDSYRIEHVVTAGSPVANHPVPHSTWMTSIEMEDELVAALDGAANPSDEHWLTIRGRALPEPSGTSPAINADGSCLPGAAPAFVNPFSSAPVEGAAERKESTHHLRYHQAAYRNASDLGSPAVQRHERHFQDIVSGKLEETSYWQGRMASGPPTAPGERIGARTPIR